MSEAVKRLGGDQGDEENRHDNGWDEPRRRGARVLCAERVNRGGRCLARWIIAHDCLETNQPGPEIDCKPLKGGQIFIGN